jgi:hypothetical protein
MSHGKHTRNSGFQPGNHWVVCQRCHFDYRESDVRKDYNGLIVCEGCYEPRHEQDFNRAVKENSAAQGLVNPRETLYTFVSVYYIFTDARAGIARAGLSRAGQNSEHDNLPAGTFGDYT